MNRFRATLLAATVLALVFVGAVAAICVRNAQPERYLFRGIRLPLVRGVPGEGYQWREEFLVAIDSSGKAKVNDGPVSAEELRSILPRELPRRHHAIGLGADKDCSFDRAWHGSS
jgi:hypothetical protein